MAEIKLNIGCASRPLSAYVNIDMDSLEEIKKRYPHAEIPTDVEVVNYNIFALPYKDGEVSEVRADSLIEHLSFPEEPRFFYEVKRVLKKGGLFHFSTPDFEDTVKTWLTAEDNWKDFYRADPESIKKEHWFGNYSYTTKNRWGYLSAMIFGSQNGEGQFHRNCYTVPKIRAILKHLEFKEIEIAQYRWKGDRDLMIDVKAEKL